MKSIRKITLFVLLCVSGQALLTPTRVQAGNRENALGVAAVAVAGFSAARTAWNYYKIWSTGQKIKPVNPMVRIGQEDTKFYNWRLQSYPTAGSIAQGKNVANRLQKDIKANKLALERGVHNRIAQQAILDAIAVEKTELSDSLKNLEHFVKYFTWINVGPVKEGFGLHRAFEQVCDQVGVSWNPSEWDKAEELSVEHGMNIRFHTGWTQFFLLKPNYGPAARVYWETFKRLERLKAIEAVVMTENPNGDNRWPPIIIRDERRR